MNDFIKDKERKMDIHYSVKEIYKDTYCITDPGIGFGSVNMYLLIGDKRALLIDSGYGALDLRNFVNHMTDKEVICMCTHGHLDHALGAYQFDEAYLNGNEFEVFRRHSDPDFIQSAGNVEMAFGQEDPVRMHPMHKELVARAAKVLRPEPKELEDCGSIDLGKRVITWQPLPGHTQGSLIFVDKMNDTVFEGDAAPIGAWIFLPESSPVTEYIETLEKYKSYLQENGLETRYVGHASEPNRIADVERLIKACRLAEKKPKEGILLDTLFGKARVVFADQETAVFAPDNK